MKKTQAFVYLAKDLDILDATIKGLLLFVMIGLCVTVVLTKLE